MNPTTPLLAPKPGVRILALLAVIGMLATFLAPIASVRADDISNNLDLSVDAIAEAMSLTVGGPSGATQLYVVPQNSDGKNGCNLTGSSTLVVAVISSDAAVATVSPNSVTFTSCGTNVPLTVTPQAPGTSSIFVSIISNTTAGTFNLAPATFSVNVAPPANTPPVVAVTGVTDGVSYEIGSVPTATCSVTDAEDGSVSVTPVFSGTLANGLGTQTATCTYADSGGLTRSASATYAVVDTGAPLFSCEAPAPDVWYGDNQSVMCSVQDEGSGLANPADATFTLSTDIPQDSYDAAASTDSKSACDNAGNCVTAGPYVFMIDREAPTISSTRTFTSDGSSYPGDWTRNKVTVTFWCNDNGGSGGSDSYVLESETPVNANGESFNGSITSAGICVDPVGNESAHGTSDVVQVDKKDPIVSPDNIVSNAWRNSPLSQDFEASDPDSGLADPADATFTLTASADSALDNDGNPIPTTDSRTVEDNVGNSTTRTVSALIDTAPPTITANATTADGSVYVSGQWTNQTVTVHFTCADALSGVFGSCPADVVIDGNTDSDGTSVSDSVSDLAGNSSTSNEILVRVDKTSPIIAASAVTADGAPYAGGWTNQSVTVSFACSDALSGLAAACPPDVMISNDTPVTGQGVSGSIQDVAGNSANSDVVLVSVDKSAPTFGIADVRKLDGASYTSGADNWSNQAITVTWPCLDTLSGPLEATVSDTKGEGANQTANGACSDVAGNVAYSSVAEINVDLTLPTDIAISNINGPYYFGSVPPLSTTCTAFDALSGLDSCVVALAPETNGLSVGIHTLVATATDIAGNAMTERFTYEVLAWTPHGFYQPVDMGNVVNTVKAGSTIPLKFEVFAGGVELTDTLVVKGLTYTKVTMSSSVATDEIELVATGGTVLRYDATSGQFIYNWSTKGLTVGQCYRVTVTLQDGSTIVAYFKMK